MKNISNLSKATLIILITTNSFLRSQNHILENDSSNFNNKAIYVSIGLTTAYSIGSLYILSNTWYKDRESVPFHFFNDNKGFLQVDKFGHAFGSYIQSYIGYNLLRNYGVNKTNALIFGGCLGIILQTPIEIMDGTHEGWGFSWGDMLANSVGSSLVIGQELLFNEQIMKFKFSYWGTKYADISNGYYGKTTLNRILKDYNGHTYWFSFPINKILNDKNIPQWLNIAIGYGANGMIGEFKNLSEYNGIQIPYFKRYRQFLFSLDIDWTKIYTESKLLKTLLHALTFVKLPFTTFEINSKGEFKTYILYF